MKILIIQHFGQLGGSTLSSFDIVHMLKDYHEVVYAVCNPSKDTVSSIEKLDVQVLTNTPNPILYTFHNANRNFLKCWIKFLITLRYREKWISFFSQLNPDLVILNSSVLAPLIEIAKNRGIKVLCFVRETLYKNSSFLPNVILRKMLSRADGVCFLTYYDKNTWKIQAEREKVIADIVYPIQGNKSEIEIKKNDNIRLLYLGGFSPQKGILFLLESIEKMCNKNKINLTILGEDGNRFINGNILYRLSHFSVIKKIIRSKRLLKQLEESGSTISVKGLVKSTDEYYKKTDIVIFPVQEVHQPRPLYEAGFHSKPVILPDVPNFKENFESGFNGIKYKKDSILSLAKVLDDVVDNKFNLRILGANNHMIYQKKHSYYSVKEEMLSFIDLVCQSH